MREQLPGLAAQEQDAGVELGAQPEMVGRRRAVPEDPAAVRRSPPSVRVFDDAVESGEGKDDGLRHGAAPLILVPAGVTGRRYLPHIRLPLRTSAEGSQ